MCVNRSSIDDVDPMGKNTCFYAVSLTKLNLWIKLGTSSREVLSLLTPRGIIFIFMTLYILTQTDPRLTLEELYTMVNKCRTVQPETFSITGGDFNKACLKKATLWNIRIFLAPPSAYLSTSRPQFGNLKYFDVFLLPTFRQWLKGASPAESILELVREGKDANSCLLGCSRLANYHGISNRSKRLCHCCYWFHKERYGKVCSQHDHPSIP